MTAQARSERVARARRARRTLLVSVVLILAGALILPLFGYLYASLNTASAQFTNDTNPRSQYWRAVREGDKGYTAIQGQETNVLIQNGGQNWRQVRNGPIANIGGWVLFAVVLAILLFFAIRGPVRLEGGKSDRVVPRWALWERILHWYTAVLFIFLAITGLSLLYGRAVLIPLFGLGGFSGWAEFSKTSHNIVGPFFSIGVVLTLILSFRHNLWEKGDWEWIKKAGGFFSAKSHPPSGRVNVGQKVVAYWAMFFLGLAVVVTGFIMDFPNFGQIRETMQLANMIHASAAALWIALILGHIYLGTVGVEGAYEGMATGYVDENFAKQHHSLWYPNVKDQARPREEGAPGAVTRAT
jgi:formate dehydrogenase subunit gamma